LAYWCDGFWADEVPESPKFHDHPVGVFVDASVKFTVSGAAPVVGAPLKAATGDVPLVLRVILYARLVPPVESMAYSHPAPEMVVEYVSVIEVAPHAVVVWASLTVHVA
jgi:hypothetical protein